MSLTTDGILLRNPSRPLREFVELLSSMRFAIALLSLICIASVIGTVVQQHQPAVNYVNQFGPFWADVFGRFGLYKVYSTPWFLLILAFLVTSTTLCIARNTPKILQDLRTYKEHVRESALASFHHRGHGELALAQDAAVQRVSALLATGGWKARAQVRSNGVMVAAKRGAANRLGYLAAHSAIVLICIGGLFDGDLIVRAQMALLGKTPFGGSGLISQVRPEHRLSPNNPTFRANLFVPEGARAGAAVINLEDGIVLQELPFEVELKKFTVEYYATGMPKLFASDIVIHDRDGTSQAAVVKVNEPVTHRGITIYQSSFEDGGSRVTLQAHPFGRPGAPFDVKGEIGGSTTLDRQSASANGTNEQLQLEFTGLRTINVENLAASNTARNGADVRGVDLVGALSQHLGSGAKAPGDKALHNVGPSISYKLRDASGQAREFNNYMLSVALDDSHVFLFGMRDAPDQNFRYLRVPADAQDSPQDWLRLKAALSDAAQRNESARRYAAQSTPPDRPQLAEQLRVSAQRALALFAGAEAAPGQAPMAGLQAVQRFLEANVPEADRGRTTDVLLRILNGSLFELLNLSRAQAGLPARVPDVATQQFMAQSVLALADSFAYPAPLLFTLKDFQQVQASVFQVTRAPGKTLVYLGCLFLIVGVFAMLYIRERRLWIWITPAASGGSMVTMALSATRQTLDTDREFEALRNDLLGPPAAPPTPLTP